jgi:membrane-bound serine protease (ClpP class)
VSLGWIVLLYLLGAFLVILELFTPGIVLGLCGLASMAAATYFLFEAYGAAAGSIGLFAGLGAALGVAALGVRRMRLAHTQDPARYSVADPALAALVGAEGVASSPLRPTGVVRLGPEHGERRIDVVTRGEMIDAGTRVEVIEVDGNRVVVRAK